MAKKSASADLDSFSDTTNDGGVKNVFNWETHLIPAEDKTEKWALGIFKRYVPYLRPVYTYAYNGRGTGNDDIIRSYANGTQDPNIYRTMFSPQDKEGKYLGINFTNLPAVIPRFRQKLIADILKIPIEIEAKAVDPIANNQRGKDKERLKMQAALDEKLAELSRIIGYDKPIKSGIASKILKTPMGQVGGQQQGQQGQPVDNMQFDMSNDEELQLYMDAYYSLDVELAQELTIESIFKLNKIEDTNQLLIQDAIDYGRVACRCYCSNFTGMPTVEYLDVRSVLVPATYKKDMTDGECWAIQPMVTLNQVLKTLGHCLTVDDIRKMYETSVKLYGYRDVNNMAYPSSFNSGRQFTRLDFDIIKIPLYYMEFRSPNIDTYEQSTTRYGDKKLKKKDFYYESDDPTAGKVKKQQWYDVIYKGYYVQGVDRVFDYGILPNMVREKGYEQMTPFSMIYWKFDDRSVVERMIPHADNIIIAWLKLQYMLLKAKPPGVLFNVSVMQDIVLGNGGIITATEVAKMYEQTGSGYFSSINEEGINVLPNGQAPHQVIQNGLGDIMPYWQTIRNEMQMIDEAIGLNEFTNAATPNTDALVGVQKMAVLNSQDARYYLQYGMKRVIENVATRVSLMVQQIAKYNPSTWAQIKNMVGAVNIGVIETMDSIPASQFAIFFRDVMTEQEKAEVKQFMLQAYAQGKLDLADILQLYWIKNYKLLVKLLTIKYNKRQAQQMQMQQQGLVLQQRTEQEALQAKLMIEKMAGDNMARANQVTGQFNLLNTQLKEQGDWNKKLLQVIEKLNLAHVNAGLDMQAAIAKGEVQQTAPPVQPVQPPIQMPQVQQPVQ